MGNDGAWEWFPEGERFVIVAGIYSNWSAARGQDVNAWVVVRRERVLRAAMGVLRAAEREPEALRKRKADWETKIRRVVQFLKRSRAKDVRIRHHYAWN
jgi:hypothetical protein